MLGYFARLLTRLWLVAGLVWVMAGWVTYFRWGSQNTLRWINGLGPGPETNSESQKAHGGVFNMDQEKKLLKIGFKFCSLFAIICVPYIRSVSSVNGRG